jgi:type IV secretory pathway VirB4 component
MFDGPSTIDLDPNGPGVVIDLSAVHHDPEALGLVMIAATSWLQSVMTLQGRPRIQVLDEAWALLANERAARYLQACFKLGRSYGVANIAIVHRLSDLRAQADDGTALAKVTAGFLADAQTRIVFRQSADQVSEAQDALGLTETEAAVLPRLARGRALWKYGPHAAIVQHVIGPGEAALCDTDARMGG